MGQYYWYHFYNGVFKKELRIMTEMEQKYDERGMLVFNQLFGCQKCSMRLREENDEYVLKVFREYYNQKHFALMKKLNKMDNEMELLQNTKIWG